MLQVLALLPLVLLLAASLGATVPGPEGKLALGLFILNPGFLFLCGVLNNDLAAFAAGTLVFAALLAALRRGGLRPWTPVFWGVLLGLAALSKLTALGLGGAVLWTLWRLDRPRFARHAATLAAVFLAVAGWWFLRNLRLYGDPWAWQAIVQDCPQCIHPKDPTRWRTWWYLLRMNVETFWSVFGWMTWRAPVWVTLALTAAAGSGFLGLLRREGSATPGPRPVTAAWLAVLGVLAVVLKHNLYFHPPHGRYFAAALLPLTLLVAAGWRRLVRVPGWAPWLGGGAMVLLNLWLLFGRLLPLYYPS
jgi:hypothetical protein